MISTTHKLLLLFFCLPSTIANAMLSKPSKPNMATKDFVKFLDVIAPAEKKSAIESPEKIAAITQQKSNKQALSIKKKREMLQRKAAREIKYTPKDAS